MAYLGSWKIDDYLTFYCNTHDPDTGVVTDADSVPSYRVYEDETGTAILTGSMAKLDDANTTGFYSERIQLTAANGFEKGRQYVVYISATVGGDTGTIHHTWQMEAEVDANSASSTVTVAIADDVIKRSVSNVEASANPDSIASLILAAFHSAIVSGVWTLYRTDDATVFDTYDVTEDSGADPITGVADPT